jgi:hypothetical protein
MNINLQEIKKNIPGLTETIGEYLYEACVVCLKRQNHDNKNTILKVKGDFQSDYILTWDDLYNSSIERAWKDQNVATESGAICISILLLLKLTDFTIIERSAGKNGFDYWLGFKNDPLFQKKGRLEISGLFSKNEKEVDKRYKIKEEQTKRSDNLKIPAFIGIVEFSIPMAKLGKRNDY